MTGRIDQLLMMPAGWDGEVLLVLLLVPQISEMDRTGSAPLDRACRPAVRRSPGLRIGSHGHCSAEAAVAVAVVAAELRAVLVAGSCLPWVAVAPVLKCSARGPSGNGAVVQVKYRVSRI